MPSLPRLPCGGNPILVGKKIDRLWLEGLILLLVGMAIVILSALLVMKISPPCLGAEVSEPIEVPKNAPESPVAALPANTIDVWPIPTPVEIWPTTEPPHLFELEFETNLYIITGYAVGDDYTPGRITASGRNVMPGLTAACPEWLPLGTAIYIEGLGLRICEDRGGAIDGWRIDVAFGTPEEALEYGVRQSIVAVIR